ncbi:MAG: DoxX family protein [Actinomycetota bacterium]
MRSFDAAMLLVRAAIGLVFLAHGVRHLRNRRKVMAWTSSIGFTAPRLQWAFMALGEVGVGAGMALGFLTACAAAGVVALLAVAFWTVHRRAGFFVTARPDEGYEYVLVLGVSAVAVAVAGPGAWAIDHALGIVLSGAAGGAACGAGVVAAVLQIVVFYRRVS